MRSASEDEQDDEFLAGNGNKNISGKSKAERAEELRKMMDDEGIPLATSL